MNDWAELKVRLSDPEFTALVRMAEDDVRPYSEEIRFALHRMLIERGYLFPVPVALTEEARR